MPSLRRHLLLGAAASITAVFAILAGILYLSVRHWLIAEFDRGLMAQVESLKATIEFHHGKVRVDFDGEQPAQFVGGPHPQYFELWQSGRPIARSPSLGEKDLRLAQMAGNRLQYNFEPLPGAVPGRQVSAAFELRRQPEDGEGPSPSAPLRASLTLAVARDTAQLSAALAQLRLMLAGSCGAALLIGLGLLAWIIRRALLPVDTIAGTIERVGRASLSDRLEVSRVPRELRPIVDRLNEMLARLEAAFGRERAFTADVAHELRTPLAGLETSIEVCASRTRQPHEYQRVLTQCLGVVRQMHATVDSLLTLARADAGTLAVARKSFRLDLLLDECWSAFSDRAAKRGLRFTRDARDLDPVYSDREKIRQILHNLYDNAVAYADEGGTVGVQLTEGPEGIWLSVTNSGSRLSQEQADHVFERFWRGDAARSETGRHCGLGLAITRELVAALKGTIQVISNAGGEFRVRLTLPIESSQAKLGRISPAAQAATINV